MPVYTYRCLDCNEITEHFSPINAKKPPVVKCEYCDGPTRKIIMETPHCRMDWKAYSTEEDGMKLVIRGGRAEMSSPLSDHAGKRV